MTPERRFWSKVDMSGGDEACWPWLSSITTSGYGQFWLDGRPRPAHRVAWTFANHRPISTGMHMCHICDNPPCVNPAHLWPGTPSANTHDMWTKGRAHNYSTMARGERHHNAILTEESVREMRRRHADGESLVALRLEFGVAKTTAESVVSRRSWKHVA